MKKIARFVLVVILVSCTSLSVFAAPIDCRRVTDPQLIEFIMSKSIPFAAQEAKSWCRDWMEPDRDNIVYVTDWIGLQILVPMVNDKEGVCGVYVGICKPLSGGKFNLSEGIRAITNQSELTKYFNISFGLAESGPAFQEELVLVTRYWDAKKEKLYKEPHEGCEELVMYIQD